MTELDYLDPLTLKDQCNTAIANLNNINLTLTIVENNLNAFILDEELKSDAYDALKLQIGDYLTLIQAMRDANSSDVLDFTTLRDIVGDEILDGKNILTQKAAALREKEEHLRIAWEFQSDAASAYSLEKLYYENKANEYFRLADIDQEIYDEWQDREELYNQIQDTTKGLFQLGTDLRQMAQIGLSSISKTFQSGSYFIDSNANWRTFFASSYETKWFTEDLKKLGYTQNEIDILAIEGITLTQSDIIKIKKSSMTENIFIADDCKSLFYNGKIYCIKVPTNEVSYEPLWVLDSKRKLTKTEFNLAAGALGIELEDIPKEKIYTHDNRYNLQGNTVSPKDNNATSAVLLHTLMGLGSFFLSSLNHTEITIYFQSHGDTRNATITVGDFQTRQHFQSINYAIPINTYGNTNDVIGKQYASDIAAGVYQLASGNSVPVADGTYTILGNLDERHRESNISGYLSYSSDKSLMYTPLVFSGDKAYIATCDTITGNNPQIIYDFTDKLSNPTIADKKIKQIFEKTLEIE